MAASTRPAAVAASRGATWLPAPAWSICCAGPKLAPLSIDIAAKARTPLPALACQATVTRPPAATMLGVVAPLTPLTTPGAVASPTTAVGPTGEALAAPQ